MAEVKNICVEALERYCSTGAIGCLDLRRGEYEGQIFVQQTYIIHARIGNEIEGIPALFRLFDWGDAETIWQPNIIPGHNSLHLQMDDACVLYAENLRDRSELETRGRDQAGIDAPELAGSMESVLKHYTISLECSDQNLLPEGFVFSDSGKSSYVIGSSDECDVVLKHSSVDPLHCGVILEKGAITIWDLGSQTGIKVNGIPITEDKLNVGDVMALGNVRLQVRFQLRRPNIIRPVSAAPAPGAPTNTLPMPKMGPPSKIVPKGPITYDKVNRQLQGKDSAQPFLRKLGSLFGGKDRK